VEEVMVVVVVVVMVVVVVRDSGVRSIRNIEGNDNQRVKAV
jgi:hypothetical protein